MRLAVLLLSLWPALAHAGLFDREDPAVKEGNEQYGKGDYPGALDSYGRATASKPDAVLDFDRGDALLKAGRLDEAQKAYLDALTHGASGDLASRAYANLGHTMAELGHVDDAVKSYRRALEMNPADEKARHDLGYLLAKKEEQKKQDQQKQQQDQQKKDDQQKQDQQKQDQKQDQDKQDQKQQDRQSKGDDKKQDDRQAQNDPGQQQPKNKGDEKQAQQDAGQKDEQKPEPDKQGQPSAQPGNPRPMARSEAERLLDSLREGEKSFQLWRQQQKKTRRTDADKDW